MSAEAPYEKGGGVEDPRLVKIGHTYYLTYTGYNNVDGVGPTGKDAQLCLATSTDLVHWKDAVEEPGDDAVLGDPGVAHRHPFDVRLVDHRLVIRRSRPHVAFPVEGRIDDDALHGRRARAQLRRRAARPERRPSPATR